MNKPVQIFLSVIILSISVSRYATAQKFFPIDKGWSQSSVNAVIFRKNAVISHGEDQYIAYYDPEGRVVLAKRTPGSDAWQTETTPYSGNVEDAHNSISIAVDGDGYLHMAWDHHGDTLNYAIGRGPGSLEMSAPQTMTGREVNVTYPEFYTMPDGDLLFLYRSGISGRGNLVINRFDTATRKWNRVQDVLISGEDERNAYWQAFVDERGTIHVSWVWRETWDVETNHDLAYARSEDGGRTWVNSDGQDYELPITESTAEVVAEIEQGSELINQTSMYADSEGRPYIATYWKEEHDIAPQFRLVFYDGSQWRTEQVGKRTLDFSLSGGGTKKIPVSRPQLLVNSELENPVVYMVYRDAERGNKASVSFAPVSGPEAFEWLTKDLTTYSLESWEPSFDPQAWRSKKEMHLFIQKVGQGDGETLQQLDPQMVQILVWKP